MILITKKNIFLYLFQESFERYVTSLPKTRLLRNSKREGLIRSRMFGAEAAKSKVVVFLDAHTEANVGWLEPLLQELVDHPSTITQPFVDGIDAWNINYSSPPTIYKGAFSWDLRWAYTHFILFYDHFNLFLCFLWVFFAGRGYMFVILLIFASINHGIKIFIIRGSRWRPRGDCPVPFPGKSEICYVKFTPTMIKGKISQWHASPFLGPPFQDPSLFFKNLLHDK